MTTSRPLWFLLIVSSPATSRLGYRQKGGINTSSWNATTSNFLCHACSLGYSHGTMSLDGKCYKCPKQSMNIALLVLVPIVVIFFAAWYIKTIVGDGGNQDAAEGAKNIGLSFLQIITSW